MNALVEANIDRVFQRAQEEYHRVPNAEWEDFVTSGYMGLCQAAKNYKPELGEFGKFADHRIRWAIRDQIRLESGKRSKERKAGVKVNSLNSMMESKFDRSRLNDFVSARPVPDEVEFADTMRYVTRGMEADGRMALAMHLDGFGMREIGEAIGLTESRASQIISNQVKPLVRVKLKDQGA